MPIARPPIRTSRKRCRARTHPAMRVEQRVATIDARIPAANADGSGASGVQNVWASTVQCAICHER